MEKVSGSPKQNKGLSPLKTHNEFVDQIEKVDNEISLKFNKCYKRNLLETDLYVDIKSMDNEDSDIENLSDCSTNVEEVNFSKPIRKRVKKRRSKDESTPIKKCTQIILNNQNSDANKLSKVCPALEKLGLRFDEFNVSVIKTKQAFSAYKVSTFFCMKTEFLKDFGNNLLKAEEAINLMNVSLNKIFDRSEIIELENDADSNVAVGSLTPPSSELDGNDDITLLDDYQSVAKKRRVSLPTEKISNLITTKEISLKIASTKELLPKITTLIKRTEETSKISTTKELSPKITTLMKRTEETSKISTTKELSPKITTLLKRTDETLTIVPKYKEIPSIEEKTDEEEYEVSVIKNYIRLQGQLVYKVSWRGYDSEDDTFEPADNLTGCDEVLGLFFQQRLAERLNVTTIEELKSLNLPCTSQVEDLMFEAFCKVILPITDSEKKRIITEVVTSKFAIKTKRQIKDDIIKFISMKDPAQDRYKKMQISVLNSLRFMDIHDQREKQLAHLRSWERNINTICSDPSPLSVENNVDLSYPPMTFRYINSCLAGPDITIPNDPIVGCECRECFASNKGCCAEQMSSTFAYNRYGRLRISLGVPIYECNKICKCSSDCSNRVIQKGRKIALAIFRTANGRGWGAKALEVIKKDTFVTEYIGEIISSEEAERRGQKYDAQGCTYLFDLDYNKGEFNPYTIDAAKYGNVSHFINHSCDPNLAVYNAWVDCLDPDLPRLALFAVADIKKGEELTFDYNSGSNKQMTASLTEKMDENGVMVTSPFKNHDSCDSFSSPSKLKLNKSRTLNAGKTECRCGAPNCRRFFF